MTSIDKLIYDELARRHSVVLPGTGTLEVKRRKAKKISETQIVPPQNVVVFSPDEVGGTETIVSIVAADRGIPLDEAAALYGSWLVEARRSDGSIAIAGAGEVRDGKFAVSEKLHDALNPEGDAPVTMNTKKRGIPAWVWIAIVVLAALAVLCAVRCCKKDASGSRSKPAVENVVPSTSQPTDTSAGTSATAAPSQAAGRFHVIAGAFAVESNADNFIAKIKREHPELTPVKLPHPRNGYSMVSIWQAPTEREARNKMNLYWDVNLDLWVYEQK